MAKSFAMLAHHLPPLPMGGYTVTGWLMSRKLNGHCWLWDGGITRGMPAVKCPWYLSAEKNFTSTGLWSLGRTAGPQVVHAPDWFLNELPIGVPLHGEGWHPSDNTSAIGFTRGYDSTHAGWHDIIYNVYNYKPYSMWGLTPELAEKVKYSQFNENKRFTARQDLLNSAYAEVEEDRGPITCWTVTPQYVLKMGQLNDFVSDALDKGWEGLMFANPHSFYECQRSYSLLKFKPEYETEAEIVEFEDGKTGRRIGETGAIWVKTTWDEKITSIVGGKAEFIGTTVRSKVSGLTDQEAAGITKYYKIGDTLRIKFNNVSPYGVPLHCNIYRGK